MSRLLTPGPISTIRRTAVPALFLSLAFLIGCEDGGTGPKDTDPGGMTAIAPGRWHTCGLNDAGYPFCWGNNDFGQLGNETSPHEVCREMGRCRKLPTLVSGELVFTHIMSGKYHACGIDPSGQAYCWGWNDTGQLGDGTTIDRPQPQPVASGESFKELTGGKFHSCGLTTGGAAFCWGLGDPTPSLVPGGHTFVQITAGEAHTCGLNEAGTVFCWGADRHGQLGHGGGPDQEIPVQVAGAHTFTQIDAGTVHTCGVDNQGRILCWGENKYGQLGDGTLVDRGIPGPVQGNRTYTAVAAGRAFTCALDTSGAAYCWGENRWGQLADGTGSGEVVCLETGRQDCRVEPSPIVGGHSFEGLRAMRAHACGHKADGTAICWGWNAHGQVGNGSSSDQLEPTEVLGWPPANPGG